MSFPNLVNHDISPMKPGSLQHAANRWELAESDLKVLYVPWMCSEKTNPQFGGLLVLYKKNVKGIKRYFPIPSDGGDDQWWWCMVVLVFLTNHWMVLTPTCQAASCKRCFRCLYRSYGSYPARRQWSKLVDVGCWSKNEKNEMR